MAQINIEEYLTDTKGNKSSTRLFSWRLLKFFTYFNTITPLAALGMVYLMDGKLESNLLLSAGMIWLAFDAILGIMIFAPKQMAKIEEIKELIAIAKNG